MKKFIAVLICFAMLLPIAVLPAFAETKQPEQPAVTVADSNAELKSAFADGENSLIVFVTGIGQSWSYLFDESYVRDGAFANGDLHDYENYSQLIADGEYTACWNLFNNYFDEALSDPTTLKAIVGAVLQLLFGAFTRKNMVSDKNVYDIVNGMFSFNIVDENGKCDPRVVTPRYIMPVADYPVGKNGESEAKNRFYNSIPCKEIAREMLGADFEKYLYCYNYCAFSYTSQNVDGLHEFVETVLAENEVGADRVILVPMSMGASVVSAYLAKYPDVADNHVKKVVSIVGCWKGSEVVYDLLTRHYADNSPDLFYNGLIAEMIGEPWGYLVNFVLRFFSKPALRAFIDQALGAVSDVILLNTPSLVALVPDGDYDEIRDMITSDKVRAETDFYHNAQVTLKERLAALEEQGVEFAFIAGYGLPYGAVTSDYTAFGFMYHSERTNSDEIIDISSTAPGTQFVAYDQQFADEEGRVLSPDKSIDIANTYYKDSTWFFRGQKHELEYNNVAIELAINIAVGNIKTVADCDDLEEDGYYYPQFNGSRNVKSLVRDYIPALEAYLAAGGTLTAEQQAVYDEVLDMLDNTVIDYNADSLLIDRFYSVLVGLGLRSAPSPTSGIERLFNDSLKKGNDVIYKIFGAKGFLDVGAPAC